MKQKVPALVEFFIIIIGSALLVGCVLDKSPPVEGQEPVDAVYVHALLGSDSNPGTADQPFQSIQAAVDHSFGLADKPEVRVAAGTYGSDFRSTGSAVLILKDGVELNGGYSDGDWALRDSEAYVTVIEDLSSSGGSVSDPNRAVEAESGVGQQTIIDGFFIRGGGGDISFALFLVDASPQIRNCTIDGGAGLSFSVGIYNLNAASPSIEQNTILGGNGDFSFGIYNFSDCSPLIECNRIDGAGSGTQSLAIYNDELCPAVIRNNLIDGGGGAYSLGIMNFESSPVIRNNTISGGRNSADWSVGLFNQSSQPAIQNNIIFSIDGLGNLGVYEYDAASDPAVFQNNDIFDCPNGLYYDYDGNGFLLTAADLNDYSHTTQDASLLSENNLADDAMLTDADGPDDDDSSIADNDWRLSGSSPAGVASGGLNGAHSTVGWGFASDLTGALRSPLDDSSISGWSIGAYEYDAGAGGTPLGASVLGTARAITADPAAPAMTEQSAGVPAPPPPIPLRTP
jgi:hypothetical protein